MVIICSCWWHTPHHALPKRNMERLSMTFLHRLLHLTLVLWVWVVPSNTGFRQFQLPGTTWTLTWTTYYSGWKKSCTTLNGWNPINNGINSLSTGAGFLPSTVVCKAMSYIQIPIIPPISGEIWGWFTVNALPTVPTMTSFTTPARSHFQWPLNEWRLGQISAAHSAEWSFSWRRVAKATSHEQNWWDANLAGLTVLDSLSGTNIWI